MSVKVLRVSYGINVLDTVIRKIRVGQNTTSARVGLNGREVRGDNARRNVSLGAVEVVAGDDVRTALRILVRRAVRGVVAAADARAGPRRLDELDVVVVPAHEDQRVSARK